MGIFKKKSKTIVIDHVTIKCLTTYKNKTVCLLGSGSSLENKDINFSKYDIIVGLNQVYKTKYVEYLDVIYHGISTHDNDFLTNIYDLLNKNKIIYISPKINTVTKKKINFLMNKYVHKNLFFNLESQSITEKNVGSNPLMGLIALDHIILGEPKSIDIYGFDFYVGGYISGAVELPNHPNKDLSVHNINNNKEYFTKLIDIYKFITWIK